MKPSQFVILNVAQRSEESHTINQGMGSFARLRMTTVVISIILNSLFLIPQQALAKTQPQDVVEVGAFCFRKDECKTYNASPPNPLFEAPECKSPSPGHNDAAVRLEYKYNCYANPPDVNLQVSIGRYQVTRI